MCFSGAVNLVMAVCVPRGSEMRSPTHGKHQIFLAQIVLQYTFRAHVHHLHSCT